MPASPEKEEDMVEYGGGDEKSMVTDREMVSNVWASLILLFYF